MENTTFNEYALRQMSIYDLRNFARESGVSSPTIYKKEELIEKVINILKGKEKPHVRKTMQGRPPKAPNFQKNGVKKPINNFKKFFGEDKQEGIISNISILKDNSYKPEEAKYTLNNPFKKSLETFNDYNYTSNVDYSGQEISEFEGYVFSLNNENSFVLPMHRSIDVEKSVYIPTSDMQKYNLKSGEYIRCIYKTIEIDKTKVFSRLISKNNNIGINNSEASQNEGELDNLYVSEKLVKLENNESNIFLLENIDTFETFNSIYSKNKNISIIKVCLQLSEKDLKNLNIDNKNEYFYALESDTAYQNLNILKLAIDRAKILSELGNKVFIIVNDINKIITLQNIINNYGLFDIKEKSFDKCIDLFGIKKEENYAKSINVLALYEFDSSIEFYKIVYKLLEKENCNFITL